MQDSLKKLFTNDSFFRLAALCGVVANVLGLIVRMLMGAAGTIDFPYSMKCLFEGACMLVLFLSYNRHNKNLMKGILGALLAVNLLTSVDIMPVMLGFPLDFTIAVAFFLLSLILFVNHFVMSSSRQSSPKNIYLNQIVSILLIMIPGVLWGVVGIVYDHSVPGVVTQAIDVIGFSGMIAAIVCIESRLDAYRLDRETAGWTEERGYPEGYVHQKDR